MRAESEQQNKYLGKNFCQWRLQPFIKHPGHRHPGEHTDRHLGKHNAVKEKEEWATAVKLAKQVIAGEVWIDEVGHATHYHATFVHPSWRRELDKVAQIGGHIFYKMKPGAVQLAILNEGL